ncbi:MAG TPA: DNA polymerase III subunit delta [Nocardioides sp.]|nr:DNA polymerase III subunit delta [Nocardioides sp.]
MPPTAANPLGRVLLVTGSAEFLAERAVDAARKAVRSADPDAEISEIAAEDLSSIEDVAAPSLFSSVRCVIVRQLENLSDEAVASLLEYAAAPADDIALVLVHSGGQKGSGVLGKLRKLAAVTETVAAEPKPREYVGFVTSEVRTAGGRIDAGAADLLVEAVGQDLRGLASAASQLVDDFPGEPITEDRVRQYFGGRAEVKNYVIADAIMAGQRAKAFEEIRWALNTGSSPVYILSAIAGQARTVANHVAGRRDKGVPDWKVRQIAGIARGWTPGGIAKALRAVAQADADAKGNTADGTYVLERLVLTIAALRER